MKAFLSKATKKVIFLVAQPGSSLVDTFFSRIFLVARPLTFPPLSGRTTKKKGTFLRPPKANEKKEGYGDR